MDQSPKEPIDRLSKIVVRAAGISDAEAERIGSSPFINARLRAAIEAERRRRTEQGSGWFAELMVASRAIAVLLLVTVAAVVMFWVSKPGTSVSVPASNAGADDIARVVTGGTCALSSTAECAISTEEVLATMFAGNEGEGPK